MKILLVNGPNLNMLGKRDPKQYGSFTLADIEKLFKERAAELGFEAECFQSNHEGEIVQKLHEARETAAGIVINAGAFTHYSYAIRDAIDVTGLPVMEVHISNIHERESFRHTSVIRAVCVGQIAGFGIKSYTMGLEQLVNDFILKKTPVAKPAETESKNDSLQQCRRDINDIDAQLIDLFAKRLRVSERVAKAKGESGGAIYDAARENVVISNARGKVSTQDGDAVESFMRTIMRVSRERQYDMLSSQRQNQNATAILPSVAAGSLENVRRVAYGGKVGSYSEKAARTFFPDAVLEPAWSFADACKSLTEQKVDAVVLPLANTTGGPVDTVYQLLQQKLFIARFADIPVEHCVAALPGATLADIKCVVSHPQALSQCSNKINACGWVQESIENTAYAPKYILDKGDASIAAICSRSAAEQAGLVILEENACNTTCNQTRFIVVTRELIVTPDASRLSIIMQLPHKHGSLSSTLDVFTDKGLNLASICSQPVPDKPWEYAFFVDIDAPALDSAAICALCQLSYELPRLQIMGWYGSTTK